LGASAFSYQGGRLGRERRDEVDNCVVDRVGELRQVEQIQACENAGLVQVLVDKGRQRRVRLVQVVGLAGKVDVVDKAAVLDRGAVVGKVAFLDREGVVVGKVDVLGRAAVAEEGVPDRGVVAAAERT
jgi:hypothetical protein